MPLPIKMSVKIHRAKQLGNNKDKTRIESRKSKQYSQEQIRFKARQKEVKLPVLGVLYRLQLNRTLTVAGNQKLVMS